MVFTNTLLDILAISTTRVSNLLDRAALQRARKKLYRAGDGRSAADE